LAFAFPPLSFFFFASVVTRNSVLLFEFENTYRMPVVLEASHAWCHHLHGLAGEQSRACSFGWRLMVSADLF
jgi:hypothetical protein